MTWSQLVGWTLLVLCGSFNVGWSLASGRLRVLNNYGYLMLCCVLVLFFINQWRGGLVYGLLFAGALTFNSWGARRALRDRVLRR